MRPIAVCDPYPAIRALIAEVGASLGRPVIDCRAAVSAPLTALIVEPAAPEAIEQARELRRAHPDMPVIFLSKRTAHPAAAEFRPAAYIMKPFALGEIETALLLV